MFPPIVRMTTLETLDLSLCTQLRKLPEIKVNMDSLRDLILRKSGIEVIPSSIGQYCTNLVLINMAVCRRLKSIEGNFRLLNRLKRLNLAGCERLENLPKDLFEIECGLEELCLSPVRLMSCTGLQFFCRDVVRLELAHLPRFITKLILSCCNLVDGDIVFDIGELSNLQELWLSGNYFSRLPFSISQLSQLKYLQLSDCTRLVELPELPSSIAVLNVEGCDSLEIVGDLPRNCKWLWKVAISGKNKMIGGEILLQSMLQGIAIENHFMSLALPGHEIPKGFVPSLVNGDTFTLQLPQNWYNDFSGFLLCAYDIGMSKYYGSIKIIIKEEKEEMDMYSQYGLWRESDFYATTYVGYISFNSLRHTKWWNSAHNMISFRIARWFTIGLGVRLLPRRSKGDTMEIAKATTDCSEFWDEQRGVKTFEIIYDSKSFLEIRWMVG